MKKKILIVDDERPLATALSLKFGHEGFEATVAIDGAEALDHLAKEKFDLVLLDLIMPNLDGFAVLEDIKKKGINTPVIVSSNLSQSEDFDRAKSLGATDYFVKSNTPINDVINKVNKILG